jgi:hypothetical protein
MHHSADPKAAAGIDLERAEIRLFVWWPNYLALGGQLSAINVLGRNHHDLDSVGMMADTPLDHFRVSAEQSVPAAGGGD